VVATNVTTSNSSTATPDTKSAATPTEEASKQTNETSTPDTLNKRDVKEEGEGKSQPKPQSAPHIVPEVGVFFYHNQLFESITRLICLF